MNFASMPVLLFCAAGCASNLAPSSKTPERPEWRALAAPSTAKTVELRHYYLLSPGAHATLVVTERDLSAPARESAETEPFAMESATAPPR